MKIGFLGPAGTHSHECARAAFGDGEFVACASISDVVALAAAGGAGVVPLENSASGTVAQTLDAFVSGSDVSVAGCVLFAVRHALLSNSTTSRIARVYSHPEVTC